MRRILIIAIAVGQIGATVPEPKAPEHSQAPSSVVSINAIDPIFGMIMSGLIGQVDFEYHHAFNKKVGLSIDIEILRRSAVTGIVQREDYEVWGLGFLLGPRFFLSGEGFSGFYCSVMGGYARATAGGMHVMDTSGDVISAIVELGYSKFWDNGFVLNFGTGANLRWVRIHDKDIIDVLVLTPRVMIGLGYGW